MTIDLTRPLVVTHPNWPEPRPARLLCHDLGSATPIVVAIGAAMAQEWIEKFHRDGTSEVGHERLRNATTPREGWIVVNRAENAGCWGTYSPVYDDRNIAERVAEASGENMRVARVEWEEDVE